MVPPRMLGHNSVCFEEDDLPENLSEFLQETRKAWPDRKVVVRDSDGEWWEMVSDGYGGFGHYAVGWP